jgi:hypothetical protein
MQLDFALNISDNDWYPTADIDGFKTKSGASVDIKDKLIVTFSAPGKITEGDINVSSDPWMAFNTKIESSEIGGGLFDIKLTITSADGNHIGNVISNIHLGVNASSDTTPGWSTLKDTFVIAADEDPNVSGQLTVKCATPPAGLENETVELDLVRGEKTERLALKFGTATYNIAAGNYQASIADLKKADGTVRAAALLSASELTISQGKTTSLNITFGKAEHGTTIDVALDVDSIPALRDERFHLVYKENGVEEGSCELRSGEEQRLEQLPVSGKFALSIADLRLNNIHYTIDSFTGDLNGQYHGLVFKQAQVHQSADTPSNAVKLTVKVNAEKAVATTFSLRLKDSAASPREYRFDNLPAQQATLEQTIKVAPGTYTVESSTFIQDGVVHYVDVSPNPFTVQSNTPAQLTVAITEGANLHVKGFPEFLSFGACANMSPSNVDDFAEARVASLFKYSGDDGMGDAGGYLDPAKEPTAKIIEMARDVSAKLNDSVLPVMVSYTCNLSLGDVPNIISDPVRHKFSFANFIQALKMAQATKDASHPVPAGFIVNPDYLGECQKYGFSPDYAIPVRKPLGEALAYHGVNVAVPSGITDSLKGYIKGVNWLARVVAPDVVLGWQVNLWSIGGSQWIYNDFSYDDVFDPADGQKKKLTITPELAGKLTAEYALLVGVFEETAYTGADGKKAVAKGADFMAVDRYEADDFTLRSYMNGYCYSPFEWDRTFDYCASLSRHLRQPVLPWQIPASRLATKSEHVGDVVSEFWGTGGSYLMGHAEIGNSVDTINETLLNIEFPSVHAGMMGHNPRELFNRHTWDMTTPKYLDFPSRGIFHVQVGGGATTGVVSAVNLDSSKWMRGKLKAYRDNPVKFK